MLSPKNVRTDYAYDQQVHAIHMLRVNVKSLAAESRVIRQEERRCGAQYRASLSLHRRIRLREESRYAGLALAFVRNTPYRCVEHKSKEVPSAKRLFEKIRKFTCEVNSSQVERWLSSE